MSKSPSRRAAATPTGRLAVSVSNHCPGLRVDRKLLIRLVKFVARKHHLTAGQIELAVFDDTQMARLAKKYLGHCAATDVLCFDLSQDQPGSSPTHLSLALGGQVARRQARSNRTSINKELALYTVHGLLHALGYDDAQPVQARRMHRHEDQILREFGIGSVYNKTAS